MSAWSEAVWVAKKIKTVENITNSALGNLQSAITGINTTVTGINSKIPNNMSTLITNINSEITNQEHGLLALYNQLTNSSYGLEAIANLAVKKNVILTTNSGTNQAPQPTNVNNSDVVNGALFFINT